MIDANTSLTLSLPAGMCAVILEALKKVLMPYEATAPVINELRRQIQVNELRRQIQVAEPNAFETAPPPRVNGIDAVRE